MKYSEYLTWTIRWKLKKEDREIRKQIDFVRSIGQKSNTVGSSRLDLHSPSAQRVLQAIEDCCMKNGVRAEGIYERKYDVSDSQWYVLKCRHLYAAETNNEIERVDNRKQWSLPVIKAAGIIDGKPREHCWYGVFVPDRFRRYCIAEGIYILRFCWVRDCGRKAGEQYFSMLPEKRIARRLEFTGSWSGPLSRSLKRVTVSQLGGCLERLAEVFASLKINVDACYLEEDMPEEGVGYFCSRTMETTRDLQILIRKDIAEGMIREGAVSRSSLIPVAVLKQPYAGSRIRESAVRMFPDEEVCQQRLLEYEKIVNSERPARKVTDRMALQLLRKRKQEMPEDFNKRMTDDQKNEVREDPYLTLLPYYAFADGFGIDETGEYRFLSYRESRKETVSYRHDMLSEELAEEDRNGIVIACCGDGDRVILNKNGTVRRLDRETAHFSQEWLSVADFMANTVEPL
ncbi:MAG: hypothetical protein J5887_03110 [Erysipelotrichaceae bacterium]|nr:hypothetical protein [Erysipelotrichaceae bacterium]